MLIFFFPRCPPPRNRFTMTNLYSDSSYHNLCHTEEQQQFLFWIKEYNVSMICEYKKDAIDSKNCVTGYISSSPSENVSTAWMRRTQIVLRASLAHPVRKLLFSSFDEYHFLISFCI